MTIAAATKLPGTEATKPQPTFPVISTGSDLCSACLGAQYLTYKQRPATKEGPDSLYKLDFTDPALHSTIMATPPVCTLSDMYTHPDSAVLLFNCGAKFFFQFIIGDLPSQWLPFVDSPIYANDIVGTSMNSFNYPLCPHQSSFAQNILCWCLSQKRTPITPCWLVVQADINRAGISPPVVKWAREIRLTPGISPPRSFNDLRMPSVNDHRLLSDSLPLTRSGVPSLHNAMCPAVSNSPHPLDHNLAHRQMCEPLMPQAPPTPANSLAELNRSSSPKEPLPNNDNQLSKNPNSAYPLGVVQMDSVGEYGRNRARKNSSRNRLSNPRLNSSKVDKPFAKALKPLLPRQPAKNDEDVIRETAET
ncbi:hypothetical protein IWW34DRAFT_854827 [Fusarium oxysporum f. sp. albedinis]|nr:hypothetical protein IWW34DRAFT_854827 [Fusarium oxysporum f. sp. albedinis]